MLKAHQQFDLFEKKVFEKAIFEAPLRLTVRMPNDACFYYVVEGNAKVVTPYEEVSVKTQEGLVMQCGNYLNEYFSASQSTHCEAIAIHLYPEVLKMLYDKEFPDFMLHLKKARPIHVAKVKVDSLMRKYMDSLHFYFDNPDMVSDELLKLKLKELILLLVKTDNVAAIQSLFHRLFNASAVDFQEVIESNLYNNCSLEELAALTNLSLSSFKRAFVRHYNCSPAKYIRRRRLEQAAKLLKATALRVSDIAFDCGFKDLAHFSKVFQKAYQYPPSTYRQMA
ncbi:MAG: helix-turn-helix transcriptional regulator [Bacteroidota bacterium]